MSYQQIVNLEPSTLRSRKLEIKAQREKEGSLSHKTTTYTFQTLKLSHNNTTAPFTLFHVYYYMLQPNVTQPTHESC